MVCEPEDIPGIKGSGRCSRGVVAPGGGLVIARVGCEAAVEDADEAVADVAKGGVVRKASCSLAVVVGACAG